MKRLLLVALGLLALSGSAEAQINSGRVIKHVLRGGGAGDSLTFASAYTSHAVPCFGAKAVIFHVTADTSNGSFFSPQDSSVQILVAANEDSTSGFYAKTVSGGGTVDPISLCNFLGTASLASPTGFDPSNARTFMLLPPSTTAYMASHIPVSWVKFRLITKTSVEGVAGYKAASSYQRLKIIARVIY